MASLDRDSSDHDSPDHDPSDHDSPWPHRFAVLTAIMTLPLLFVGGLVTSLKVGMVVPDWPTTFGYNMFLYPWSKMIGGIFYEHSHRLLGSAVGLLTILLAVVLWLKESRQWLRWLGLIALGAVILQGVLGGLRVILVLHKIAIIHACVAQAFFALVTSLALFTSREWKSYTQQTPSKATKKTRQLGLWATGLIYAQLILGAVFRHTGAGLSLHILGAVVVFISVFLLVDHVQQYHADQPFLMRSALVLRRLLLVQVGLGFLTYVVKYLVPDGLLMSQAVLFATSHVIIGALMLVTSVRFALRAYHILVEPQTPPSQPIFSKQVSV